VRVSEPAPRLSDIPLDEALERWASDLDFRRNSKELPAQLVGVEEAVGRLTSETVVARLSSPNYYAAATSGLAIASYLTLNATSENPLIVELREGLPFVETGYPMPQGCNTVIPFFELTSTDDRELEIARPSAPWRNVRPIGEDLAAGEVILPKGHRVRSLDLGALIAGGISELEVEAQPRIRIIPIGSDLVEPGRVPAAGQKIDHTSPFLAALGGEHDILTKRYPPIEECRDTLTHTLENHQGRCDLLVFCVGHGRGTALLAESLAEVGECTLRGVAIRPGNSVVLGFVGETPVIGLSSHLVPAYLGFCLFGLPAIRSLSKARLRDDRGPWPRQMAKLALGCGSAQGVEEFLRVKMGVVNSEAIAVAESGGHGTLMSLLKADGLIQIPSEVGRLEQGTQVEVLRLRESENLTGHLLVLGTHDITYDLLRDHLHDRYPQVRLHTAAVGGRTGLDCLKRGQCHGAAAHLFDELSGEYNVPFLQAWDWDEPVVVIQVLKRWLGLAVAPGNPRNIQGLQDLSTDGIRFVNRQPGSGTRSLLDYHLKQAGVNSSELQGYDLSAHTHMSIAAAVKGGTADAGPTISTAARSLGLGFVPCISERLDFIFPKRFLGLYPLRALLAVMNSSSFRDSATERFPDYDFSGAGQLIWETP
jgi:molybdopterin molybdotransferase/putative molybdopterin biosynthesis protein